MEFNEQASVQLGGGSLIVSLIIAVVLIIAQWKIFTKAGKPGWHSIIPFLNMYDLFTICGWNGWFFLLLMVPIVNIYFSIAMWFRLAKAFGKGIGFGVGLLFFGPIFELILGFGSAQDVGYTKA